MSMLRVIGMCVLLSTLALAQQAPAVAASPAGPSAASSQLVIPSGTEVPVALKHAISTKSARDGDPVYAQTTFPVVMNQHILIPAGTYLQGRITHTKRAGRVKGRAEVLIHFTTLIYPSGYTVLLPGAVENVPGAEKTSVKDSEGTIRQDRQTGEKVGKAAEQGLEGGMAGAVIGGLSSGSGTGAGVGAGVGGLAGIAIAMLTRGSDVRLDAGTTVQMVIQRDVPLDATRLEATK
jgi:type IV secretory pathway VirB10-like protein